MKRALGAMAANWLRKPENQERIKRTARDVWGKFQQRREARKTPSAGTKGPQGQRPTERNAPASHDE
tara:strand:+ start:416 stop:616 length:201 start_codon:yes stop_codon:yes gene_type:complete